MLVGGAAPTGIARPWRLWIGRHALSDAFRLALLDLASAIRRPVAYRRSGGA